MTVTKNLALKIKAAGFPQESEFYYISHKEYPDKSILAFKGMEKLKLKWYIPNGELGPVYQVIREDYINIVSAPTASEILAELPIREKIDALKLLILKYANIRDFAKQDVKKPEPNIEEALGEMYLQLKKEKVI